MVGIAKTLHVAPNQTARSGLLVYAMMHVLQDESS